MGGEIRIGGGSAHAATGMNRGQPSQVGSNAGIDAQAPASAHAAVDPAPASATPVGELLDQPSGAPADDAAVDAAPVGRHKEADQAGVAPQETGFFKALLAKAQDFFQANKSGVIGGAVLLGGLTLATGGAALLPALIGLAVSAATNAALNVAAAPGQAPTDQTAERTETSPQPEGEGSGEAVQSPQQFEEQQRRLELERQLQEKEQLEQQHELESFMAAESDVQPHEAQMHESVQEQVQAQVQRPPAQPSVQGGVQDPFQALWDRARKDA